MEQEKGQAGHCRVIAVSDKGLKYKEGAGGENKLLQCLPQTENLRMITKVISPTIHKVFIQLTGYFQKDRNNKISARRPGSCYGGNHPIIYYLCCVYKPLRLLGLDCHVCNRIIIIIIMKTCLRKGAGQTKYWRYSQIKNKDVGEGRAAQERGIYIHTHTLMADLCCTAEPTQYYKAVTLQLKNKFKKVDHSQNINFT